MNLALEIVTHLNIELVDYLVKALCLYSALSKYGSNIRTVLNKKSFICTLFYPLFWSLMTLSTFTFALPRDLFCEIPPTQRCTYCAYLISLSS